jgi:predicted TIM-barrel fold metal-dependent hydrolase
VTSAVSAAVTDAHHLPTIGTTMSKVLLISSDGHATARQEDYARYLDPAIRDEFQAWLDSEGAAYLGINASPAVDQRANYDSDYRIQDLESQGVAAEVLFPNSLPFGFAAEGTDGGSSDRGRAQIRAALWGYNRWIADFVAQAPERRVGLGVVSFDDVDEAVRMARWAKQNGLKAVQLPGPAGEPWFFDEALDPFWACCEELELPVVQHAAGILPRPLPRGFAAMMTLAIESSFFTGRSLHQMILGGVFDRYPTLRYVVTEGSSGWIPERIGTIDLLLAVASDWQEFATFLGQSNPLRRTAREVWDQNCFVGASGLTPAEGARRKEIGVAQMMYGLDYPHFEGTYPATKNHIRATLAGADERELRAILGENAARCYGIDVDVLAPHVERIGFAIEDLIAP